MSLIKEILDYLKKIKITLVFLAAAITIFITLKSKNYLEFLKQNNVDIIFEITLIFIIILLALLLFKFIFDEIVYKIKLNKVFKEKINILQNLSDNEIKIINNMYLSKGYSKELWKGDESTTYLENKGIIISAHMHVKFGVYNYTLSDWVRKELKNNKKNLLDHIINYNKNNL